MDIRVAPGRFTIAEFGGLASWCLSTDCSALLTAGFATNYIYDENREDGPESFLTPSFSASLLAPLAAHLKLVAEIVGMPRFDRAAIAGGWAGARLHADQWALDVGLFVGMEAINRANVSLGALPFPWLSATDRIN